MDNPVYEQYINLIGKLKDIYKLDMDVDHNNIHTFYREKRPLFKLFYGMFTEKTEGDPTIVVSFHLDLHHPEAIHWFINIYSLDQSIQMHDSYIEDSNGECFLGEDALVLRQTYLAQDILEQWLEQHSNEEIKEFVDGKVVGRQRRPKIFDSQVQKEEAIMELGRLGKPDDDTEIQ